MSARAQTLPFNFTVEGRLYDNAGVPLSTPTGYVMLELLSEQSSTCVLFREQFPAIDLTSSDPSAIGVFSLRLGSGARSFPVGTVPLPTFFKAGVFSGDGNGDNIAGDCSTSLTAVDHTLLRIKFKTSGGASWETLSPDTRVTAVPTAMVADSANTLQGLSASSFLLTNLSTSLSQANLENVFSNTNYSTLSALLSGGYISSTPTAAVSFNSQRLTNVADPVAGQDVATKAYTDGNLAGRAADTSGVGLGVGGGKVLIWDQALAKWVAQAPASTSIGIVSGTGLVGGTITSFGTLSVDVGTTGNQILQLQAGGLPAVDGYLLTNIQFPVFSVAGRMGAVSLTAVDIGGLGTAAAKNYGLASGNLVELVAASKLPALEGSLLTNVSANAIQSRLVASVAPASGQVLTWNGSQWEPQGVPVSSITALTGDVTASGTGAAAATISNAAVTSAKIGPGYSRNLLLITDGTTGATVTYASGCANSDVMKFSVATGWGCAADANSGGTVTSITAGAGLLGGVVTSTGAFSVDVGTTAGKIVQLDGSGRLPAVDGSLLTNMPNPGGTLTATAGIVNVSALDSGKIFKLTALTNVNLPTATGNTSVRYQFIRRGGAKVFVFPSGSETINGKVGKVLASDYSAISVISDGSEWLITSALGTVSNYSLIIEGILSPSFNGQGYLTHAAPIPGASYYNVNATTTDASGRYLVSGAADMGPPNDQDLFVARFNSDGTPDVTFGTSGVYVHPLTGSQQANAIAVDGSGNIVVAGNFYNASDSDIAVIRLNSTGALDTSFDGDGVRTFGGTDFGYAPYYNSVGGLKIDSSGKIVVGASIYTGVDNDFAAIRLNANGSFDTSFNSTGYALTDGIGYGGYDWTGSVAIDSANNIYLCGNGNGVSNGDLAIIKFTNVGLLDAGFGTGGKFSHDGAGGISNYESCTSIKIEPSSGKLIAMGSGYNGSNNDIIVWRVTTAGVLDTSFASTGFHRFNGPSNDYDTGSAFAFDSFGNILVTGSVNVPGQQGNMLVYRLTPSGVLDTTFNTTGYMTHHNAAGGNGNDVGRFIQVDGNGVTVVGTSFASPADYLTFWRLE